MQEEQYVIDGYPDTPYYQDQEAREKIEEVLEECAKLYAAKGQRQIVINGDSYLWAKDIEDFNPKKHLLADDLEENKQKEWYATQESNLLSKVLYLDENYVSNLFPEDY